MLAYRKNIVKQNCLKLAHKKEQMETVNGGNVDDNFTDKRSWQTDRKRQEDNNIEALSWGSLYTVSLANTRWNRFKKMGYRSKQAKTEGEKRGNGSGKQENLIIIRRGWIDGGGWHERTHGHHLQDNFSPRWLRPVALAVLNNDK